MPIDFGSLDRIRRTLSPIAGRLVDGLVDGRVTRREVLRHGSVIGLSLPVIGGVFATLGQATLPRTARAGTSGGTIRLGHLVPSGSTEPATIADPGGIALLSICGEYLCTVGRDLILQPGLAESWSPNSDGTVWTFKIRKTVTFHDGRPMSASDVVATFQRLADPDSESNALTAFNHYLSKDGIRKVDDATVEFHLDAAHGQFPYLVSSDNYNTIILPADYRGDYAGKQVATGPFKLESYTPGTKASYIRYAGYWGAKALSDRIDARHFPDEKSQIAALLANEVDVLSQVQARSAIPLQPNPSIEILAVPSTAHNQVHMRTDMEPFRDPRVRRAMALTLDRPKIVHDLLGGRGQLGNDSPFAPVHPSTDKEVSQRARNIAEARQLLDAAGMKSGFVAELTSQNFQDIPALALTIQSAAAEIGAKLNVTTMEPANYFADGVFGKSPWLDSVMGITDYLQHSLPNAHLFAPLHSNGAWNAARYKNPAYDSQVSAYIAALDPVGQRSAAAAIQKTLLDDTPVIFAYFTDALGASRKTLSGVRISPLGQIWLAGASLAQ